MNKKKMLAVVAAVAMTAAMSLPVFAEDATPGDISENNVEIVKDLLEEPTWTDEQKNTVVTAIEDYVKQIDKPKNNVVTEDMAVCAIETYNRLGNEAFADTNVEAPNGSKVVFHGKKDMVSNAAVQALTVGDGNASVEIEATAVKSELGYIVDIPMPGVADGTEYSVVSCSDEIEYIQGRDNANENFSFKVKDEVLTIWVPHFTTYTLDKVSTSGGNSSSGSSAGQTSTAAPTATATPAPGDAIQYYTCPACGYHNWTATSEGYRCDNCGRVESEKQLSGYGNVKGVYEPTAAVAENPIKATGSDMSLMVFAVVALVGVAACGLGVASKKSRKGE